MDDSIRPHELEIIEEYEDDDYEVFRRHLHWTRKEGRRTPFNQRAFEEAWRGFVENIGWRGSGSKVTAMVRMLNWLPSLKQHAEKGSLRLGRPGRYWSASELERWAATTCASPRAIHSARFLLYIWDPDQEWACGNFNLKQAFNAWDEEHRSVFVRWAADPWWG